MTQKDQVGATITLTHLKIPTMLTIPASFHGLVVEGCFEVLNASSNDTGDFEEDDEDLQATRIKTTKKKGFINVISKYLHSLSWEKIASI